MRKHKKILILLFFCLPVYAVPILFNKLSPKEAAIYLNWTPVPVTIQDLCGGYYKEPEIVYKYPIAADMKTTKVTVTAEKRVFYAIHGDSVLTGNVTITQPGRLVKSDKIILHRSLKTGKITSADLIGHVELREFGKLVVGNTGYVDFANNFMTVDNGVYWITSPSATGTVNLTGRLKYAKDDTKNKVIVLKRATYSTCRPDCNVWHMWTSTLRVDRKKEMVYVHNPVFFVKDVPMLYLPYLQFSLDKKRKTGFLYPSVAYSKSSGIKVGLPLYLNLAPNYDATLTPNYFSKRGFFANGQLRFLTSSSSGELDGGYIYQDRQFTKDQKQFFADFPNDPAADKLRNDSANRGYFKFEENTRFNQYLSADMNLNYVSDDYFLNDFSSIPTDKTNDQLLNKFDLKFANEHWRFLGRVQGFQTLHMVNDQGVMDQYTRLPQLDLTANYPDQWLGMDYKLNSEYVNFTHWPDDQKSPFIVPDQLVIGQRFNVEPSIGLPLNRGGVYINPNIQLPVSFYELRDQPKGDPGSINRVLPIVDLDTGLSFARNFNLFGESFMQTLEPRAMYLFVPVHNQDDIPTFDSTLPALDFNNIFRTNRFSGIDRVGDANQVALGLTSRFLDGNTGQEKMKIGIAQIFALQKHQVCLHENCALDYAYDPLLEHNISPLVSKLQYNLSAHWNISGDAAWDVYKEQVNNGKVNFQYLSDSDHIINIGYNFLANGDLYNEKIINLNRIDASISWVVFKHLRLLGEWNYDFGIHHSLTYLYGLEYNTCCWSIRAVYNRVRKIDGSYDDEYGIQIMLKGIGSYGYNDPGSLLTDSIPGFRDNFATGFL